MPIRWFRRSAGKTPQSLYTRADELERQGDLRRARTAYQRAIDSGDPHYSSSLSALNQSLYADHGDIPAVRAAHQRVIDTGFVDLTRGAELHQRGDTEAARAAYEHAIALGHPEYTPAASNNLGVLLKDQGDVDGAIAAYRQAIDSGHPDQQPKAAINLGLLYKRQRDYTGARAAFQQAIDSGHPDCARLADDLDLLLSPTTTYGFVFRSRIEHEARRIRREAGVELD